MNLERICYGCFQEKPEDASVCPHCGFDANEEQPFLALPMGTLLNGRYMTGKVLGVGGFGITYLGYDLTLEIQVAIKEYMPSGLATRHSDQYSVALTGRVQEDYQNGMERFLEEARILAKLQNTPNVVSVQNYFKENGTAYFVMEYVDGMSLKSYLASQGGKIPCEQALTILMPVMQALTQVHALNLTHRDISPDNISITAKGESKLLDFGAARFSIGDDKSVSVILKHGYAPEEQYSSRGNQGPWTDVYAMGATLYRCVTGELPPDSIMRIHSDTLKKPSELGVFLPPHVERAIMKALAVKAEDRFPTMEAFVNGLNGSSSQISYRYRTAAEPVGQTVAGPVERTKNQTGRRKRSGVLRIVVIALAVLVIGGGVWKIVKGLGGSDEETTGGTRETVSEVPEGTVQMPEGVEEVALKEYTSSYLNFTIGVPEGFEDMDASIGAAFASPDKNANLQIKFYDKDADFPVYTLSDMEENAEKYVQYYLSFFEETKITKQEILSQGYRKAGSLDAYMIQFSATESGGSVMEFLAAFIETQNGFGCYSIVGAYPQGAEETQAEIFAAINSFQINGPANTTNKLFSDDKLPFRFLYWDNKVEIEFEVVDEQRLKIDLAYESTNRAVDIQCRQSGGQITKELWLDTLAEGIMETGKFKQANNGERWDMEAGGVKWIVDEYTYTDEKGNTFYIGIYSAEIDGYVFGVTAFGESEGAIVTDGMLLDVTSTLRPIT